MNVDKWIEALQHPLVLAGFGLFLFAALIKPLFLNNKKLSGTAMERLLHKGMNFAFALALLAIAGGLLLSWKSSGKAGADEKKGAKPAAERSGDNQNVAVNNTGPGTVTVNNYGLNKEQYEEGQKKLADEIVRRMQNADAGQRAFLEQKLKDVQEKLADKEKSWKEELSRRKAAEAALEQLQRLISEVQIEKVPYLWQYKIALEEKNLEHDIVAEKKMNDVLNDILQRIDHNMLRMAIFDKPIGEPTLFSVNKKDIIITPEARKGDCVVYDIQVGTEGRIFHYKNRECYEHIDINLKNKMDEKQKRQ